MWPPKLFPGSLLALKRAKVAAEADGRRVEMRGWRWPEPVDKRSIAREFKVLRQVFRWGHDRLRPDGTPLLQSNPFKKIRAPADPIRPTPIMTGLYTALREVAAKVHPDSTIYS